MKWSAEKCAEQRSDSNTPRAPTARSGSQLPTAMYPLRALENCVPCKGKGAYGNLQWLCRFGCQTKIKFLEKYDNSLKEKKYKFVILIFLVFLIFISRNISRIDDEIKKYSFKPFTQTYYKVDKVHFRIDERFKKLILNFMK